MNSLKVPPGVEIRHEKDETNAATQLARKIAESFPAPALKEIPTTTTAFLSVMVRDDGRRTP